jgi:3-hydroxyisobutyrate dehydrogenase
LYHDFASGEGARKDFSAIITVIRAQSTEGETA